MASRDARDEDYARARIREALLAANDPERPIKTMLDFLKLVRGRYLAPELYEKHEETAIEIWSQRRNTSPLTPAESTTRDSPDSKASDVLMDNLDDLPSLEAEAEISSVWIVLPTKAEFAHASCKPCSSRGSYIRADSVQNNDLRAREDGLVVIQWDPSGPSGVKDNSNDHAATHTVCRVVNEEQAKSRGMNVDLVLGTDCKEKLEYQLFGAQVMPRASRRLPDISEAEEPQISMPLGGSPSSQPQPGFARLQASFHPIINITGTAVFCSGVDIATTLGLIPGMGFSPSATHGAAPGLPGNGCLGPGVGGTDVLETSEGSRKKRKIADEHESRFRERTERPQD